MTPTRSALIAALLVAMLGACTSTRDTSNPTDQPTATGPASPSEGPTTIPGESVTIQPPPDGSFLVHGLYPRIASRCKGYERARLTARYPGELRVERSDDGTLAITVTLTFEKYLEGIAEVPPSWPRAALEAQAIAARSYALATTGWSGKQGAELETPICATTACQVYRGIPVPRIPQTRRWYRAVRRTTGKVLVFRGRPAETVYFSTSNGQTYGNEDVFGSSPLPYLRPVVERFDGASPTSHWRVSLPYPDVARFLREAGEWGRTRISDVRLDGSNVRVSGAGRTRTMDLSTFRDAVNVWASCLQPGRYPPGALPTTIPSHWLSMTSKSASVVVTGRGWGHGVGMVQWGAYGRARRGESAAHILSFYYGGLRPRSYPEPGLIHVEVVSGLTKLKVRPSDPGADLDGRPLTGVVVITGGEGLTVDAPA